jgi:TolA-binding protein
MGSPRESRQIGRATMAVAAATCLIWTACSQDTPEQAMAAAEAAARAAGTDSTSLDVAVARFGDFLERYPRHESAPKALRMLAMITQQEGDMRGAIGHYERLLEEYASSEYADDAQFMIGFISEEYLEEYARARESYRLVIDRYPDSELAASARRLLPNVGKSPEEWVKFQEGASSP